MICLGHTLTSRDQDITDNKAKKGGFKDCLAEDLLAAVLKESIKRTGLDPAKIG